MSFGSLERVRTRRSSRRAVRESSGDQRPREKCEPLRSVKKKTSLTRRSPQEHERSLDLMFPKSRCENDLSGCAR